MTKPIQTPDTNVVFKLPGGTDENNLPVEMTTNAHGEKVIISTWELDAGERQAISQGATIELVIWGEQQPPVSLAVNQP